MYTNQTASRLLYNTTKLEIYKFQVLPPRNPPYIKIRSPTAAAACLQRRVSSTEASPPAASALYLPVLGLVTTDFASHHTPAAVSSTKQKKRNKNLQELAESTKKNS